MGVPEYAGCLAGTTIMCAAPAKHEEAQLVECVEALGGKPVRVEDIGKNDFHADFLVSAGVLTKAYQVVQSTTSTMWMPKLSPSWLTACQEAGQKVSHHAHTLKPLSGISISISGGLSREKSSHQELIKKNGGLYSPDLNRSCTHLLIMRVKNVEARTVSAKEIHGRTWESTQVVWDSWLIDNCQAGFYKANEKEFQVPEKPGGSKSQRTSQNTSQAKKKDEGKALSVREVENSSSRQDQGDARCPSMPSVEPWLGEKRSDSIENIVPTAKPKQGQKQSQNSKLPPQSDPAQDPRREAKDTKPNKEVNIRENTMSSSPSSEAKKVPKGTEDKDQQVLPYDSTDEEADMLFLSGALVHLICCFPKEQLEMRRILREGACTSRPDLAEDVTHIVVGSDLTPEEVQAISDHSKKYGHVSHVVKLDWLRQCFRERKLLPVGSNYIMKPSVLLQSLRAKSKSLPSKEISNAQNLQASNDGRSRHGEPGPFDGYFFTVSALKGTDDETSARNMIRQGGGRFFDHRTISLIVAKEKTFAICPPSLPLKKKKQLCKECPDFGLVFERNQLTLRWLDLCCDAGKVFLPSPDQVECRPLNFSLPLPDMNKVRVVASNLDEDEKNRVKLVTKILGGSYTVGMSSKNTHLIIPFGAGDKFNNRQRYDVIPVTGRWLFDIAMSGRILPEKDYFPPPPAGTDVVNQSQFPFEANGPIQDHLKQGTQRQPHLLQKVMNGPSQAIPKFTKPKASQGPSRLDTLFSQLKTPVKGSQKPKTTPLKDKIIQHRKRGKEIQEPKTNSQARFEDIPKEPQVDGNFGQDERPVLQEIEPPNGDEGKREEHNSLVGGSLEDIDTALALFGNALQDMPDPLHHSSQYEAPFPSKSRTSEASGEGLSKKSSPGEIRSRSKRPSRQDSTTSQDASGPRKRSKQGHQGMASAQQDFEGAQMECSQRVGYEGLPSNVHHQGGARPRARPSRMAKSSKASELDQEVMKQRLLQAVEKRASDK